MFKSLFFRLKKFYVTTSIAYVNSEPHIGFALESIQGDVLARYYRQAGYEVYFQTGTDEFGSKIQRAAVENNKTPQDFVDGLSLKFKGLKEALNLSWDNFVRTTDQQKHWPVAQEIWRRLLEAGDLYKKKYSGYYCIGCESFKTEKDIIDGKCVIHKKKLELIEEENWFFKLSKYTKEIESKIQNNELRIIPESRRNEILSLLKDGLEDVSFSRSKKTVQWGLPVPNDESQIMYVWTDALTNYISGYGGLETWKKHPADVHVIGKDISRFHTALWPAMLISARLPLPKIVFIHGFITANGEKMSKSLGNVIDPYELIKKYASASSAQVGTDAVRYYLLREIPSAEDGDFSYEKFEERYNGDLANGLGNFSARVSTLASKEGVFSGKIDSEVKTKIREIKKLVDEKVKEFKFNEALSLIWELIQFGDKYVNENKPWDKNIDAKDRNTIIFNLINILKEVGLLLAPFLPETSEKILNAIKEEGSVFKVEKITGLFPRIEK